MKLELWYSDMVSFMTHASEYGEYYQQLVCKMLPYLSKAFHICDAGSGLGYLSLALAPHVRQVTAVEKHPDAAAVLERNCRDKGVPNVVSQCAAVEAALPDKQYDAMVFCFFGSVRETLITAKQQCRDDVFVFTRNYTNHRFSAGAYATGMEGYPEYCCVLEQLGIPYEKETFALEFGQPFRDFEEARLFFRLYSKDTDKSLLTEEFLRNKLTNTGREDFPLYLPHRKQIAFFHFSAKDIPEQIG